MTDENIKPQVTDETPEQEAPTPSYNQPLLDSYVELITAKISEKTIVESYINEDNFHLPTLIVDAKEWLALANLLRDDEEFAFDYLMNLSGVDYIEYMEVIYHLYSYKRDQYLAVKVKTARDGGSLPSVMEVWRTADWQERETYDLLGINFTGREITRILLPDDWVGYPLRKDYVMPEEEV